MASTGIISGDTNGFRTNEVRHAVDYSDANGDLGRLLVNVRRPETVSGGVVLHKSSEIRCA
ncbi:MAG: hypothetical protein E5299_00317 [Burkholderia gladioli]|nr:MAG: hypothetical protein E5299_00317 [Burkholderia gladioli]